MQALSWDKYVTWTTLKGGLSLITHRHQTQGNKIGDFSRVWDTWGKSQISDTWALRTEQTHEAREGTLEKQGHTSFLKFAFSSLFSKNLCGNKAS